MIDPLLMKILKRFYKSNIYKEDQAKLNIEAHKEAKKCQEKSKLGVQT